MPPITRALPPTSRQPSDECANAQRKAPAHDFDASYSVASLCAGALPLFHLRGLPSSRAFPLAGDCAPYGRTHPATQALPLVRAVCRQPARIAARERGLCPV